MPNLPEHALGLFLTDTEALLAQEISAVEWAVAWEFCLRDLAGRPLEARARQCLERLRDFALTASLPQLDQGLAELRELAAEWDHWWWVAQRSGEAWAPPDRPAESLRVTRQAGRSRITWHCSSCEWSFSWDVETAAWEVLDWPGVIECPLCSRASNDDHYDGENPRNESGP
ncbi:hypothetical protein ABS71_18685 [bacterium SCN 62-11]|nr:hypothetical protein [Candidatus Eremiobacteraeota bacterium]ODT58688.1 MAG: hypothetical protein ABS71_18685 [bacterium SCN 62-11]